MSQQEGGAALPALQLDGIEKAFGDCIALHGASLEVTPGEIHALVGENGAGKSTLMRVLGGLIKPDDVRTLSNETGLVITPERLVSDLSVGEAQRVEILKVLFRGAKILVLDEPTAVLSPPEVKELWAVLRKLRDNGATIVLITHRLDEVVELSDTITVMRGGQTVARLKTSDTNPSEIARLMVGREVSLS